MAILGTVTTLELISVKVTPIPVIHQSIHSALQGETDHVAPVESGIQQQNIRQN